MSMFRSEVALALKISSLADSFLLWPSLEQDLPNLTDLQENFPLILSENRALVIDICNKISQRPDAEVAWSTSFNPKLIVINF